MLRKIVIYLPKMKMPEVKLLHQDSQSNSKVEYIMGHSIQAASVVAGTESQAVAVPLSAQIHGGIVRSNRSTQTLLGKLSQLINSLHLVIPYYLMADAMIRGSTFVFLLTRITRDSSCRDLMRTVVVVLIRMIGVIVQRDAAATVAGVFIPGTGIIRLFGSGSIAIEGMVIDGKTGELLAAFRDREADKSAPISVRDYQMYAHIRRTMDDWADQLAELAGTVPTHQVKDSLPFTLKPL